MPVTWAFDPDGIAILTLVRPYTFHEWRHAMDEILAARSARPLRVLSDRRAAEPPDTTLVEEMIGYFRAHAGRLSGSVVAIAVSGDASFGMARMLEIRAEVAHVPIMMKIFLHYDDALRWLRSVDPSQVSGERER